MGMWLLRNFSLRFKGKLARLVVILLGVCMVSHYFLLRQGTVNETTRSKHVSATLNKSDEKPYEDGLETRLIRLQRAKEYEKKRHDGVGKNWKHSSRKKSKGNEIVTSEFKISIVSNTSLQYTNQDKKLNIQPSDTSSIDHDIEVNEKHLEKKTSQDSLENDVKISKLFPDPDETDLSSYICPRKFISVLEDIQYGKCKPHKPSAESCLHAERLYFLDKNSTKCKINRETTEICNVRIDTTQQEQGIVFRVGCHQDLCVEKWYSTSLAVWTLDRRSGDISRVQSYSSILKMEKELPQIIIETVKKGVNFVVLKCSRRSDGESVTQLIPINPRLTIKTNKKSNKKPTPREGMNVNILLLDSVSRAHFYRSLPKTIDLFKNWSASELAPAKVFDFELFQAIHGHTAENTHALFTGKTLPPHLEDEFPPVEMGVAFGRFVKAGYQTLWQEDLCWKGGWGLMTDLGEMAWEDLDSKLQENFIHSTGITHSSCEVLHAYELETPFNGPEDNQICYNGKFQHEYLLNYTLDTIDAIRSIRTARPLLSYMSLSVGHDNSGRRVQTLDQSLADYVDRLAKDDNTLTIILADHGNTYTEYTVSTLEGRFEMYHPSLFMIVPRNVGKRLGNEAMGALRTNQRRLVNMYDLHYTLMALAGPLDTGRVSPQGVFRRISADRTCNEMKLLTPNLCVCDGWDSPTTNDTLKISLVEFAVGELNHFIDKKFMEGSTGKENQFPLLNKSCRRLVPLQFENVRERLDKNERLRTTMDIHVRSLEENPGKKETFHVEIESKEAPDYISMDLRLVHFDRMSVFEQYKKCSDNGVTPLLCICSKTREPHVVDTNKRKIDISVIKHDLHSFQSQATVEFVDKKKCLLLVRRQHAKQSFSRELVNLCLDFDIFVLVNVQEIDNMKFSRSLPAEIKIPAGSMRLVFTARKDLDYWPSSFDLKISVTKIRKRSHDHSRN